jgi:hypothetical protein
MPGNRVSGSCAMTVDETDYRVVKSDRGGKTRNRIGTDESGAFAAALRHYRQAAAANGRISPQDAPRYAHYYVGITIYALVRQTHLTINQ